MYNDKIEYIREVDFDKYNSFFLELYKDCKDNPYLRHMVRPSTATYDEIQSKKPITLEGAVITFNNDVSLEEILVHCAVRGLQIDYIEMITRDGKGWNERDKIVQIIDCHKEDVTKMIDEINAPRYYMTRKNKKSRDNINFLVVDRFSQKEDVKFLKGEYNNGAIVAGFKEQRDAREFCNKLNKS